MVFLSNFNDQHFQSKASFVILCDVLNFRPSYHELISGEQGVQWNEWINTEVDCLQSFILFGRGAVN